MQEESQCDNCGATIVADRGSPKEPCPGCGSMIRIYHETLRDSLMFLEHTRIRGRHAGGGRPFFDDRSGASYYKKDGVWHHLTRQIDRENDRYVEIIKILATGEVIKHVDERLSDHIGHGSDKPKESSDEP